MSKIETRKLPCLKTTCLWQHTYNLKAIEKAKRTLEAPQVFSIETFLTFT